MPFISEHTFTSPFQNFTREEWKRLNGQLSNMLAEEDLGALHALNEPLTMEEIEEIYIPLAHLWGGHITGFRELQRQSNDFLRRNNSQLPFTIVSAGHVAVGQCQ